MDLFAEVGGHCVGHFGGDGAVGRAFEVVMVFWFWVMVVMICWCKSYK